MASTEFSKLFSERLKTLREHAGFKSQEALANALEIAQGTVGNWEAGRNTPTLIQTIELARALRISVGQLLGEKEIPASGNALESAIREIVKDELNSNAEKKIEQAIARSLDAFLDKIEQRKREAPKPAPRNSPQTPIIPILKDAKDDPETPGAK